jgi:uncharacterized membrane protein
MMAPERKFIVARHAGPGTASGAGDTVIDNHGNRYRIIDDGEASMIRQSTGGQVYTIENDGTIR